MGRLGTWDGHGVGGVGGDRVHVHSIQIHIRKGILTIGRRGKIISIERVDWGFAERDVQVRIEGVVVVVGGEGGMHGILAAVRV